MKHPESLHPANAEELAAIAQETDAGDNHQGMAKLRRQPGSQIIHESPSVARQAGFFC